MHVVLYMRKIKEIINLSKVEYNRNALKVAGEFSELSIPNDSHYQHLIHFLHALKNFESYPLFKIIDGEIESGEKF